MFSAAALLILSLFSNAYECAEIKTDMSPVTPVVEKVQTLARADHLRFRWTDPDPNENWRIHFSCASSGMVGVDVFFVSDGDYDTWVATPAMVGIDFMAIAITGATLEYSFTIENTAQLQNGPGFNLVIDHDFETASSQPAQVSCTITTTQGTTLRSYSLPIAAECGKWTIESRPRSLYYYVLPSDYYDRLLSIRQTACLFANGTDAGFACVIYVGMLDDTELSQSNQNMVGFAFFYKQSTNPFPNRFPISKTVDGIAPKTGNNIAFFNNDLTGEYTISKIEFDFRPAPAHGTAAGDCTVNTNQNEVGPPSAGPPPPRPPPPMPTAPPVPTPPPTGYPTNPPPTPMPVPPTQALVGNQCSTGEIFQCGQTCRARMGSPNLIACFRIGTKCQEFCQGDTLPVTEGPPSPATSGAPTINGGGGTTQMQLTGGDDSLEEGGCGTACIVGAVLGGVLLLALVIACVAFVLWRQSEAEERAEKRRRLTRRQSTRRRLRANSLTNKAVAMQPMMGGGGGGGGTMAAYYGQPMGGDMAQGTLYQPSPAFPGADGGGMYGAPSGTMYGRPSGGEQYGRPDGGEQYGVPDGGSQYGAPTGSMYGGTVSTGTMYGRAAAPMEEAGSMYGNMQLVRESGDQMYGSMQLRDSTPADTAYLPTPGEGMYQPTGGGDNGHYRAAQQYAQVN